MLILFLKIILKKFILNFRVYDKFLIKNMTERSVNFL